jgi:membrane associated rhomboid family serine protease
MDIAHPTAEPTATAVARDRKRVGYALLGTAGLIAGIWLVWIVAWLLGWDMANLGIRPRDWHGFIGVFTAPFVHASFEHLMSNTLPLAILAALTLYAYPRATRYALPFIWIMSGLGVWLWARPSVHVGISGIEHGLMVFLFFMGLFRRDRLGVAIALVVFFLYGGMLMTVLPREQEVSFEYHLSGAVAGLISALALFRLDAQAPRKRYSWEDEEEQLQPDYDELEAPPAQDEVRSAEIIAFPAARRDNPSIH